jgi:GDPmannose 4,6-dehydratase
VRDFVTAAANEIGITLEWRGHGAGQVGILEAVKDNASILKPGQEIVRVDARYFRPTEVETLLGDPTKAKERLGWEPKVSFAQLVAEMVREDLRSAKRDNLVRQHGYRAFDRHE